MREPIKKTNFAIDCIVVGAVVGFLAFVMLTVLGEWSLVQAAFGGGVIFAIAAGFLVVILSKPLPPLKQGANLQAQQAAVQAPATQTAPAPQATVTTEAAQPAPAQAQVAAPAASPVLKANTLLDGEQELAARKGEWTYTAPQATATTTPDTAAKPAATPAAAASADQVKPQLLQAARGGQADDLKQIKGIGPKLETMLNGMGFFHFDQIANLTAEELAWVDDNLTGFKGRASRDGWVAQAKTLAAGGDTEFSKRVEDGDVY